jgi:hypothetical protein
VRACRVPRLYLKRWRFVPSHGDHLSWTFDQLGNIRLSFVQSTTTTSHYFKLRQRNIGALVLGVRYENRYGGGAALGSRIPHLPVLRFRCAMCNPVEHEIISMIFFIESLRAALVSITAARNARTSSS